MVADAPAPVEVGSVILRGVPVTLDSDVGSAFVSDCARNLEGVFSDAEIKSKWGLAGEGWDALASNAPLLAAVRAERERRIFSNECARETAQRHFAEAPTVLARILGDERISPRHRIEAARELRQAAGNGANNIVPREKFKIIINIGDEKFETEATPNFAGPPDEGEV